MLQMMIMMLIDGSGYGNKTCKSFYTFIVWVSSIELLEHVFTRGGHKLLIESLSGFSIC